MAARFERFASGEHLAGGEDEHGDPHGLLSWLYRANIPTLSPDAADRLAGGRPIGSVDFQWRAGPGIGRIGA